MSYPEIMEQMSCMEDQEMTPFREGTETTCWWEEPETISCQETMETIPTFSISEMDRIPSGRMEREQTAWYSGKESVRRI